MNLRIQQYWELLRSSYWFVPTLLCLAAAALASLLVYIDYLIIHELENVPDWLYQGSPEGARTVLSTIGGSMIGVAGVVFSITTVALTLASNQFGPRLMRNFLRDRSNQVVLGTFLATFLYCLIVLVFVQGQEGQTFTPRAAIAAGILLAVVGLGMLIYFIHHVLVSIQATHVVMEVGAELRRAIEQLLPADAESASRSPSEEALATIRENATELVADQAGYVIGIDAKALVKFADKHDLVLEIHCRPGHYLIPGEVIAIVSPAQSNEQEVLDEVRRALVIDRQRFALQDIEFTIDQLVEIAVRSLSPGINDPFTAVNCIDVLSEALGIIATRPLPSPYHYGEEQLRVILLPVTFAGIVDAAFNQIRQYGASSPAVLIRMLEALLPVASVAKRPADREAIALHARLIYEAGVTGFQADADKQDLKRRFERITSRLGS